jgi:predicted metal-dependent enzyme (double-stranded beta helix superfamily)
MYWDRVLACAARGDDAALLQLVDACAQALVEGRVPPSAHEPYGRHVLHATPRGEVMLATWHAGERCAPHDHGASRGRVVVLDGAFRETVFGWTGEELVACADRAIAAGAVLTVEQGLVHAMGCDASGATLHVYTPRVEAMRVHDRDARETFVVAEACGAWVPRDPALVVRRWSWDEAVPPTARSA